ncbi:MAG: hypothetical protein OXR07_08560 [Nitrospira sp.]|nr:hypothetical protein [Nitrospira sp.]MDD9858919.1 hypothetical protein [Nitrospira sp.]
MTPRQEMEVTQVLDTFGELLAALAALAVKVPAKSFMAIPGGLRPTEEAIEKYEAAVYRFRDRAGMTWRVLNGFFIDSLEAFEAGRVFDAVPLLFQALERIVELHKDGKISLTSAEQDRVRDFHQRLEKIFPDASQPEVELPKPESY